LLKALAKLPPDVKFQLRIIGGGPMENCWQRMATDLGIAEHLEWLGWLSHKESLRQYEWADVFAFTSLRDNSGTVVIEALANGLPVVCLDHQGPRDIVTDRCGLKVPVVWPRQVAEDLSLAVTRLARDQALRHSMSRAARDRASDFLWGRLGEEMRLIYWQVLQANAVAINAGEAPLAKVAIATPHRPNGLPVPHWSSTRNEMNTESKSEPSANQVITFPRNRFRDATTWGAQRAAVGLHALLGDRPERGFGILMYHRVADWPAGVPTPTSNVTPHRLRVQLEGLLSRGYEAWPLRKVIEFSAASRPIPSKIFVVTFDDGYENNLLAAAPILIELGVPATIFLATSFLDSDRPFPFDNWSCAGSPRVPASAWRSLTTRQCHELMSSGWIELGAHTHTHSAFANSVDRFRPDLAESVDVLKREFGVRRPAFSFPFGVTNNELINAAKQEGVACALTARSECIRPGADPFGWGRYSADDRDTVATLAAKLNGWYTPVAQVLRAIKWPLAAVAPKAIGELVALPQPCFALHDRKCERTRSTSTPAMSAAAESDRSP
jgi:peptidoglycan/xylan/chitin deacetylase (PgdA/CDA1 family)